MEIQNGRKTFTFETETLRNLIAFILLNKKLGI